MAESDLKTLGKSGKPPGSVLSDPAKVHELVTRLIDAGRERDRKIAAMQGQVDGNPPYDPARLKLAGQANRSNINTLEAKGLLSNAVTPFYDLFNTSKHMAEVELEDQSWSGVVTEEFDRMLKEWSDWENQVWPMLANFVGFGKGFLYWPDTDTWQPRHIPHHRVRVMDGTQVGLDDLEVVCIQMSWHVHQLWDYIREADAAASQGWNVDACKDAIRAAVPDDPQDYQDFVAVQQELKEHGLFTSARSRKLELAFVYVREFDGQWTLLIVDRRGQEKPAFLYRSQRVYEHARQFLAPFFFDVQEGTWNGTRGLLHDTFSIMAIKDRLRNAQIDNVFLRTSIVLQPQNANSKERLNLVQVGPITWVPPGVNISNSQVIGDVETTLAVNRDLDNMVSQNTGIYRARMEQPSGNPRTAEEVRLQFASATVLSSSAVNRFYQQADRLYTEIYRRAVAVNGTHRGAWADMAREFIKVCRSRGVELGAMRKPRRVLAMRNLGNGSIAMRQQAITSLAPMVGQFPESGKRAYLEDYVAAFASQAKVRRYVPPAEVEMLPTRDHWEAMQENADIRQGMPVQWTDQQNNVIHAQTHLQAAAQAAAGLQNGAQPEEVLGFIDGIGQHTGIHLVQLQDDTSRQGDLQALTQQWQQLAKFADELRKQIAQQAEQDSQMQQASNIGSGMDPTTAIKAAETEAKLELQRRKAATKEQLDMQRFVREQARRDASTAADIQRRSAQAAVNRAEDRATP